MVSIDDTCRTEQQRGWECSEDAGACPQRGTGRHICKLRDI